MMVVTGRFANPETHHKGWFRIFRGSKIIEVWFGEHYITIGF